MKRILFAMAITLVAATAAQAADVGVSVSIGQPGFYGQFSIGHFPPPVVYAHPVVVRPAPVVVVRPAPVVVARPVYVHVPPGHVKHWRRHHQGHPAFWRPDGRFDHR
ncbi:MAG: hypothetical protein HPY67_04875 [Syntrophaceae bacterium]|nr:hypothetical protein [Syntrophaceae bacterium]